MTRPPVRLRRIALSMAAGVAGLLLAAGTPAALAVPGATLPQSPNSCPGVWVIVDSSALGGGIDRGCATSNGTGLDALHSAGFSYTASTSGLLTSIRIGGVYVPSDQKVRASHYWSYWQSSPTGSGWSAWRYSQTGAASYRPTNGSAEGWRFINEDTQNPPAPGAKPPIATPPSTTRAPAPPKPPSMSGGANSGGSTSGGSTRGPGKGTSSSSAQASTPAGAASTAALPDNTATPTTEASASDTSSPTGHILTDGPAGTDTAAAPGSGSGGAPWALIGTLGVVVLGGGGLGVWWLKIGRFR